MAEVFLGSMLGAEGFSRRVAIKRVLPGFSDNPAQVCDDKLFVLGLDECVSVDADAGRRVAVEA